MATSEKELLTAALSRDLSRPGVGGRIKVVDDAVRRVFTANKDGAVLVFGHNQPDAAYWNGVKHYGSGPSSRIRIRRKEKVEAKLSEAKLVVQAEGEK